MFTDFYGIKQSVQYQTCKLAFKLSYIVSQFLVFWRTTRAKATPDHITFEVMKMLSQVLLIQYDTTLCRV